MNSKLINILEHAGLAALGAALTYAVAHVGDIDLGTYGPAVAALAALALKLVKEYLPTGDQ